MGFESGSEKPPKQEVAVPPQYRGMHPDAIEEIWTIPQYVDPEKTRAEHERKRQVLDGLRAEQKKTPEKNVTVSLEETELGFSGDIVVDGDIVGHVSLWKLPNPLKVFIHDIQIGYDEHAPRNKGLGTLAYQRIIEDLGRRGLTLVSTDFSQTGSSISPQALRVWEKLAAAGAARVTGQVTAKVLDRFGVTPEEVREVPTYESVR